MMTGTEDVTMGMRIGCLITLAAMLFAFATGARAGSEVDPASVSESLRAIFKYGKVQRETVERLNANTVTLMSGTIGGTFVTSAMVFERLGIKANFAYIEQRLAYERLKAGEIDAMIAVQGKPSKFTTGIKDPELHLVPVDYAKSLQPYYLPAVLTSDDYPNLIEPGGRVDTIAVPAVLAAYNWAPNTERYRKLERFVDAFFGSIPVLQKPPFHPKWKEVALHAPLSGWSRFFAAQEWLDRKYSVGMASSKSVGMARSDVRRMFEQFLSENQARSPGFAKSEDREMLFRQFLEWQKKQPSGR